MQQGNVKFDGIGYEEDEKKNLRYVCYKRNVRVS